MGTRERGRGRCAPLMAAGLTAIAGLTAVGGLTVGTGCGSGVGELVHSQQDMIVLSNARHRDELAKSGLDGRPGSFRLDSIPASGRDGQSVAVGG